MTTQDQFHNETDITLTEVFWREQYPEADDAEIAERLNIRREQASAHLRLCALEEAQDTANLQARADQSTDDSDDEDFELIEWDDDGNVIHRITSERPTFTAADFPNDLSFPENALLASRTVIEEHIDHAEQLLTKTLSPLPIALMQPAFAHLTAGGYIASNGGQGQCPHCHSKECLTVCYERPGEHEGPAFDICIQCWNVWEYVTEELKEAVTAHTEGQHTNERIPAVHRDTSSVGQTAPLPKTSTSAGTLYAES